LSRFRKTARVGADVTTCGRLFQRRLPATGKDRSPTVVFVESVTAMMTMNEVVDGWKRQRVGSKQIGSGEIESGPGGFSPLLPFEPPAIV